MINKIYNEDCLETMKRMPDNYIDTIITDPPYGLSFMAKKAGFIDNKHFPKIIVCKYKK